MIRTWAFVVVGAVCVTFPATAGDCPQAVKGSVKKSHPDASVASCHKEIEAGKATYEVTLTTKAGKAIELELSPEGTLLQTEEQVDLAAVPATVMQGLTAKYSGATPVSAEKITLADGSVLFEVLFDLEGMKREATLTSAGAVVEEEEGEEKEGEGEGEEMDDHD